MRRWKDTALYCHNKYGAVVNQKEKYFECPRCGTRFYKDDWTLILTGFKGDWMYCPLCFIDFEDPGGKE